MKIYFFRLKFYSCLALVFAISANVLASPLLSNENLPDLVEKTLPGVVNISSTSVITYSDNGMEAFSLFWGLPRERKQSQTSLGSGFIIDKDGYVFTNNHVVDQADEVIVTLYDKRQFKAKIIGKDEKLDLALLQIRDESRHVPQNLNYVPLGDSDKVRIAESVFAIGNPFGLQHTVTLGIISAKNRTIGAGPFDNFLQTDASINPGNSGGPLFNLKGEVVGINTMIYSQTQQSAGVGFAIPMDAAKNVIADLKRYGRVPRPWLGLVSERMSPQIAAYYHLGTNKGVLVYNLVDRAPADRAGLKRGDIIIGVDGGAVVEPYDVERALAKHKPTDETQLKIMRGRKTLTLPVQLKELPKLDQLPQGII